MVFQRLSSSMQFNVLRKYHKYFSNNQYGRSALRQHIAIVILRVFVSFIVSFSYIRLAFVSLHKTQPKKNCLKQKRFAGRLWRCI